MRKFILISAVVLVLFAMYMRNQLRRAVDDLDYGIAPGLKVTNFSFGDSTLILPMWINNPTNFSILLSNMEIDVFVNKIYAGKAQLNRGYVVEKQARSIIPFEVKLDNVNAMQILLTVNQFLDSKNWRDKVNISFRGRFRAESGLLYFNNVPVSADGSYKFWMG